MTIRLLILLVWVSLLSACQDKAGQSVDVQDSNQLPSLEPRPEPSFWLAESAAFTGFSGLDVDIQLNRGRWEGVPWVDGGAARPVVILLPEYTVQGDLGKHRVNFSVLFLDQSMGGSGSLLYIAAVPANMQPTGPLPVSLVGDRVKIRSSRISDGRLELDVLQAGPDDAMCCPGELATRAWGIDGEGNLREVDSGIPTSRLTVETQDETN